LHVKLGQSGSKGHGLGKSVFGQAARMGRFQRRMQDIGPRRRRSRVTQALARPVRQEIVIVLRRL
jgi:hypothetical protein